MGAGCTVLYSSFGFKLQVLELKIQLSRKYGFYHWKMYRVELASSRYDKVPKEVLKNSI